MKHLYVTNNPLIKNIAATENIIYIEGNVLEVYKRTRKLLTERHTLITHPLTGNVPPHIIPFKTIIIKKAKKISEKDLKIMDKSIRYLNRLSRNVKNSKWSEKELSDFKILDLDYIKTAVSLSS